MIDKPADRMLDRYLHRDHPSSSRSDPSAPHASLLDTATASPGSPGAGEDSTDDLGRFGYLRGVRDRALMLELRKADGSIMAIGYGWLERAEFDPTAGITLHLAGRTVRIKGRNLNTEVSPHARLFHGITRHRVPWVQECPRGRADSTADNLLEIDAIEW